MSKCFISTFISALLALSNAESDASERILRRGGGGGDKLAKLQNMIDTECTASFSLSCPDDPTDDDCTFEKPERPNFTDLSQDEIQQLKEDYRAMRKERKQQLLVCACCGGYSLDEMLPFAKGSTTATASGGDGSGSSVGAGRPGMFGGGGGGGGSRPEGAEGSGFQGGGGQAGSGRPGRGGGMRNRQPVDSEVDVSGGEESISSIDDGASSSSGDESSADADESP
ncbi:hypothetical protein QTG54_008533 [Skeletonema marinoi]|uniref:Uncharacterized protein n=1 Tax=Skeletonema marinoi TaxID=267567 RepID=A0AAD8Y693_9STRA|nr:hypothetical protein QTG54_008533 [Skeletonema marinoi]